MSGALETKICGLSTEPALAAAVDGGARFVGFVFYDPSPRNLPFDTAAKLAARVPRSVLRVGVVVDKTDDQLRALLGRVPLDMLQLHGSEDARRIAEIRALSGLPVMKAIKVADAADLDAAARLGDAADRLLFDAKPPRGDKNALPGGNALSFDWALLAGRRWARPWMLSGGLDIRNVTEAVRISRAKAIDVSSGVETRPGKKDPARIRDFLTHVSFL